MEVEPDMTESNSSPGPPEAGPVETPLTQRLGIRLPVIGGAMYPCSNPELVGAVSAAGGIGVLQPVSLTYVHGQDFREGVRLILKLAGGRPVGMNALIEGSSRRYRERMERWVDIALEEGVRFFVTSLGKPRWVVDRVESVGGTVYHDVTERKWGLKARDAGVHGLIAVNRRAGGHAGPLGTEELLDQLGDLGLPVVCAGGVARGDDVVEALRLGYCGVQMGTRFIATPECRASGAYKQAIVDSGEEDIVLSERITGVPVAVIATPWIRQVGVKAGPLARWLLRGGRTKHWIRAFYTLRAGVQLKRASLADDGGREFWQAGRSVGGIDEVLPVATIMEAIEASLKDSFREDRP